MLQHRLSSSLFRYGACLLALALLSLSLPGQADEGAMMAKIHAFLYEQASVSGEDVMIDIHPPRASLASCEHPAPFL
ncbi:MAG: hypothetical protein RI841_16070, partial [Halomonas sp.]|nr:hypothetical protein [Halomonas sp.]